MFILNPIRKAETICGGLYFSPLPSEQDLYDCGVDFEVIWNLTAEFKDIAEIEKKYCQKVLLANIDDYSIPDNTDLFFEQLNVVVGALRKGKNVLVHCYGGRGRTGMALALIKNRIEKTNGFESLWFAQENCGGPELKCQDEFVNNNLILE